MMLARRRREAIRSGSLKNLSERVGRSPRGGDLQAGGFCLIIFRRYAFDAGCDLSMMVAEPGSSSQRNAGRNGFRVAYTRTKWRLPSSS